jgi:phage FluMu protein Com
MRPRDKINKQKKTFLTLVAIGFAAMIILAFTEKYIPTSIFKPILYIALALFGVGNILLYIGIRCPKCNSIIGYSIVFSAEKVDQCPRCRVIFDENILEKF